MDKSSDDKHVAVIDNCAMTIIGFQQLLRHGTAYSCRLYSFSDSDQWFAQGAHPFYAVVIYSVADTRGSRQACIEFLAHLAKTEPGTARILLAEDERQARLIQHLSPVLLHCVLAKTMDVDELLSQLTVLLERTPQQNASALIGRVMCLSPTERMLLHYMGRGLSIPEIAVQMERSTKTIRTHKFNAMAKLGVNNDTGLLCAADILRYLPLHNPLVTRL
ncbi:MAG: DNA-binding transcriptional activator BglJ [Scandinavium sp.]|uniref:DNA-binding transcriptional activator BglJ n=1 Tax=Scandinavium sp. TaxID=2830653 RepID=UPI003F3FF2D3